MRRYTREFFELQLQFAELVSSRLGLLFTDAVQRLTTIPLSLGLIDDDAAVRYYEGLSNGQEPSEWTYGFYTARYPDEEIDLGDAFKGRKLFGCFNFEMREGGIVRPHFMKNCDVGRSVLTGDSATTRKAELVAMFRYIKATTPEAEYVEGNSWMYNLPAYCELYPTEYICQVKVAEEDEFLYLARWGQFYDREWRVRPELAAHLLDAVTSVESIERLRDCFPFPVLRPRCSINRFYEHFGIE